MTKLSAHSIESLPWISPSGSCAKQIWNTESTGALSGSHEGGLGCPVYGPWFDPVFLPDALMRSWRYCRTQTHVSRMFINLPPDSARPLVRCRPLHALWGLYPLPYPTMAVRNDVIIFPIRHVWNIVFRSKWSFVVARTLGSRRVLFCCCC